MTFKNKLLLKTGLLTVFIALSSAKAADQEDISDFDAARKTYYQKGFQEKRACTNFHARGDEFFNVEYSKLTEGQRLLLPALQISYLEAIAHGNERALSSYRSHFESKFEQKEAISVILTTAHFLASEFETHGINLNLFPIVDCTLKYLQTLTTHEDHSAEAKGLIITLQTFAATAKEAQAQAREQAGDFEKAANFYIEAAENCGRNIKEDILRLSLSCPSLQLKVAEYYANGCFGFEQDYDLSLKALEKFSQDENAGWHQEDQIIASLLSREVTGQFTPHHKAAFLRASGDFFLAHKKKLSTYGKEAAECLLAAYTTFRDLEGIDYVGGEAAGVWRDLMTQATTTGSEFNADFTYSVACFHQQELIKAVHNTGTPIFTYTVREEETAAKAKERFIYSLKTVTLDLFELAAVSHVNAFECAINMYDECIHESQQNAPLAKAYERAKLEFILNINNANSSGFCSRETPRSHLNKHPEFFGKSAVGKFLASQIVFKNSEALYQEVVKMDYLPAVILEHNKAFSYPVRYDVSSLLSLFAERIKRAETLEQQEVFMKARKYSVLNLTAEEAKSINKEEFSKQFETHQQGRSLRRRQLGFGSRASEPQTPEKAYEKMLTDIKDAERRFYELYVRPVENSDKLIADAKVSLTKQLPYAEQVIAKIIDLTHSGEFQKRIAPIKRMVQVSWSKMEERTFHNESAESIGLEILQEKRHSYLQGITASFTQQEAQELLEDFELIKLLPRRESLISSLSPYMDILKQKVPVAAAQ